MTMTWDGHEYNDEQDADFECNYDERSVLEPEQPASSLGCGCEAYPELQQDAIRPGNECDAAILAENGFAVDGSGVVLDVPQATGSDGVGDISNLVPVGYENEDAQSAETPLSQPAVQPKLLPKPMILVSSRKAQSADRIAAGSSGYATLAWQELKTGIKTSKRYIAMGAAAATIALGGCATHLLSDAVVRDHVFTGLSFYSGFLTGEGSSQTNIPYRIDDRLEKRVANKAAEQMDVPRYGSRSPGLDNVSSEGLRVVPPYDAGGRQDASGSDPQISDSRLRQRIIPKSDSLEAILKDKDPGFFRGIGDGKEYLLVIDKKTQEETVYEVTFSKIDKTKISSGKVPGDKQRAGDNRTPEGIFTVTSVEQSSHWTHEGRLAYGPYFARLNAGSWDRKGNYDPNGRSSHALHGTDREGLLGTPDSEGCVRHSNDKIKSYVENGIVKKGTVAAILPDGG
ncbi:L,D-transpeptidase [Candidatus Woesearchaeota archaeon]|nr:L,D-transpeptidase [Candidatus Woesearchaeota archaeon]